VTEQAEHLHLSDKVNSWLKKRTAGRKGEQLAEEENSWQNR
jgi:hypothetical protein